VKKLVKINERETEALNLHVNTLLNDFTKGFFYSNAHSDIIQSSLEYNNYLINQLVKSKQKLPKSEYEHGLIILWENLKKLSKNVINTIIVGRNTFKVLPTEKRNQI
jgi:hypothetical protein